MIGCDEATSHHLSCLAVMATNKSSSSSPGTKLLGIAQLPAKDNKTIVEKIESVLNELRRVSENISYSKDAARYCNLSSFDGFSSDHVASNKLVSDTLQKKHDALLGFDLCFVGSVGLVCSFCLII